MSHRHVITSSHHCIAISSQCLINASSHRHIVTSPRAGEVSSALPVLEETILRHALAPHYPKDWTSFVIKRIAFPSQEELDRALKNGVVDGMAFSFSRVISFFSLSLFSFIYSLSVHPSFSVILSILLLFLLHF